MKQNHFIFSYPGNKRNEAEEFIKQANFDGVEKIIEPFCGSAAISFLIWLKYGDKFKYYLNDNDEHLVNIYRVLKSQPIETIEDEVSKIGEKIQNKKDWDDYFRAKDNDSVYKSIFFRKYSTRGRIGLYNLDQRHKKPCKITDIQRQFIKFIGQPNVIISCDDWFSVFNEHKDNIKSMFIIDPPYVNSCNDFYINKNLNIYQYFYDNKNENYKSKIYLVLEDIWIIRMLYNNYNVLLKYDKQYAITKKKTSHIILYNLPTP